MTTVPLPPPPTTHKKVINSQPLQAVIYNINIFHRKQSFFICDIIEHCYERDVTCLCTPPLLCLIFPKKMCLT
jgi:hypothetical protein